MSDLIVRKDLRAKFGPVRDQGRRPTCLAFATSACHEHAHSRQTAFSVEWLYFQAVRRGGEGPDDGVSPSHVCVSLAEDGQPLEEAWPYQTQRVEPWSPPGEVGDVFRAEEAPSSLDFSDIIATVETERPVVLGLYVGSTFYTPAKNGAEACILDDATPPDPESGHAVLAVGTGSIGGVEAVLVRNSWGEKWGVKGHAWLPATYWESRALAAFALKARQ